jgi:hypothetical protein
MDEEFRRRKICMDLLDKISALVTFHHTREAEHRFFVLKPKSIASSGRQRVFLNQGTSMTMPAFKIMLIVFSCKDVIMHSEFLPQGQAFCHAFYLDVLQRFGEE